MSKNPVSGVQVELLTPRFWTRVRSQVAEIESNAYEVARRDGIEDLERVVTHPRSISVLARDSVQIAGFCLGAPLEFFPTVSGARDDSNRGRSNTLYAADTTVASAYRGRGIARLLKCKQLDEARAAGYSFVAGRVRVGFADAMWKINCEFGAVQVQYLQGDYGDGLVPDACIYYRIPLHG